MNNAADRFSSKLFARSKDGGCSDGFDSRGSLREPNGLIAERSATFHGHHLTQEAERLCRDDPLGSAGWLRPVAAL